MSNRLPNNFDIYKLMSARNKRLLFAPLQNVTLLRKVKAGTQVTIGLPGDMVSSLANGDYVGGLLLADWKEYREIRDELTNGPELPETYPTADAYEAVCKARTKWQEKAEDLEATLLSMWRGTCGHYWPKRESDACPVCEPASR